VNQRFITFVLILLVSSDAFASLTAQRPSPNLRLRVMALGDSLTVGWTPADETVSQGGYRAPLTLLMNNRVQWIGRQIHGPLYARRHEGWGGYQIRRLQQLELENAMTQPTDIVLLMIGTNDAWHPNEYDTLSTRENMSSNLVSFLNDLWTYQPNARVILSTLPYLHDPPSLAAIQEYNAELPDVVSNFAQQGKLIHLVDSYARVAPEETLIDSDGVHPNALGYRHIADAFFSDAWLQGFGPLQPLNTQLHAVPEPMCAGIACLSLFVLCLVRRSRI
jgi:lysophospholipase L1-like esterase